MRSIQSIVTRSALGSLLLLVTACNESTQPISTQVSARALSSTPAHLLLDINPSTGMDCDWSFYDAAIGELSAAGDELYFTASRSESGIELWKSDGTPAGTTLVNDIFPGASDSMPALPTKLGNKVLFTASGPSAGPELWETDGTWAGTSTLAELVPGPIGSSPGSFLVVDDQLYFMASVDSSGLQLWRTDGTAANTQRLTGPGTANNFKELILVRKAGHTLYMIANDGLSGREWWRLTSSGSFELVKDIVPGFGSPFVLSSFASADVNGVLYFTASVGTSGVELWKTDGTVAGTAMVADVHPTGSSTPTELTPVNGTLYFVADDGTHGKELWKTDGTATGTSMVTDLYPGAVGAEPGSLEPLNGVLYFAARDPASYLRRLWRLDGVTSTPSLITTGSSLNPSQLTATAHQLFFTTDDNAHGQFLWRLGEGSTTATVVQAQVVASKLTAIQDAIYFVVGQKLWRSDGTAAGTVMLLDACPHRTDSRPRIQGTFGNRTMFSATNGIDGYDLWSTDGTGNGTWRLLDTISGSGGSGVDQFGVLGGVGYFWAYNGTSAYDLWKTDGTVVGTAKTSLMDGYYDAVPFVEMNGALYFYATGINSGLWRTDGTAPGTVHLQNAPYGASLYRLGNFLFFPGMGNTTGIELWKTDGTVNGTVLVKDLYLGSAASSPTNFVNLNGVLYFSASSAKGRELWRSDGTDAGTVMVKDIAPGTASSGAQWLVRMGNALYFAASDGVHGSELWKSDGTDVGTVMVKDIAPGSGWSRPSSLVVLNGVLYFVANDGVHGDELWKSDGTEAGTQLVNDSYPGPFGGVLPGLDSGTPALFPIEPLGLLLFAGTEGVNGSELWQSDGTASGTKLVQDIRPGPLSSNPHAFVRNGGEIFFSADDGLTGQELWNVDLSALGTLVSPLLTCPANVTVDALAGTSVAVTYPAAVASDPQNGPVTFSYSHPSGGFFPLGETDVTVTATNSLGASAQCTFAVSVLDKMPPVLQCPASLTLEATAAKGAPGVFSVQASDNASPVTLNSVPESGTMFPLGTTTVHVTASDAAGNSSSCTFTVTVQDTTPPSLRCPTAVSAEATSSEGGTVIYQLTATDLVDAMPLVVATPPSGDRFPLGSTLVTVTAADHSGNESTCSFPVNVTDTTPPLIPPLEDVFVEATSPEGAVATYAPTLATDAVSPISVTIDPPSGSQFPLGESVVHVVASDGAGNASTSEFKVIVRDTTAPTLHLPALTPLEATSAAGARVTYGTVTATDLVSAVTVTLSPADGSQLPLGTTPVAVTARDQAGNEAVGTFEVTVVDTTAPMIRCPDNVSVTTTDAAGTSVQFSSPSTSDVVTTSPTVSLDHASGSTFPIGATTVTATASDEAGNKATCTFEVSVGSTSAPAQRLVKTSGCSSQSTNGSNTALACLALVLMLGRRRFHKPR